MGRQDLRDFKKGVTHLSRFSRTYGDASKAFEPLLWFLVWLEHKRAMANVIGVGSACHNSGRELGLLPARWWPSS